MKSIPFPAIPRLSIRAWHDASEKISAKIKYPMLADPTHVLAKDFDVLIEEAGVAERGAFIVNPEGRTVSYEVTAGNVGAMPMNFSVSFKPASLSMNTVMKFARLNGSLAKKR